MYQVNFLVYSMNEEMIVMSDLKEFPSR